MSKRRAQQTAHKGRGSTSKKVIYPKAAKGPVKPVISRTRHGKPVEEPEVSDAGLFARTVVVSCAVVAIVAVIILLIYKIFNT
jgi:hypothetical protein